MDEALEELRRRAEADPRDREAAAQLDQHLLRAERADELAQRYRFKFRCPLRFEELPPGKDPFVRDCAQCQRTVHFVHTPEELAVQVAAGACVAFAKDGLAAAVVQLGRDPRVHSAEEPARPCLQEAELVDLDALEIPRTVLDMVSRYLAIPKRVVPVAWDDVGKRLSVACGDLANAEQHVDDLRFMLNAEIEVVLADPAAVDRALERHYPEGAGGAGDFVMGEVHDLDHDSLARFLLEYEPEPAYEPEEWAPDDD